MKKYMIIALCTISTINGMEKQIVTREPREWDAKAYDEGNQFQTTAFLHFLKKNNIKTENRTIFSIGCGTGKIESILAEKSTHIHGIDASKNMAEYAQSKYPYIKNLSFEHCFAESFNPQIPRELTIASFSLHWVDDKKQALQLINNGLEPNGEFFATIPTQSNPKPLELVVALEMIPTIEWLYNTIADKKLIDLIGVAYPSHEELKTMLHETGFEILKCEEQTFEYTSNRKELEQLHWPIVSSRPLAQYVPELLKQYLFQQFIDRLITKLRKNGDDSFSDTLYTTIVHARKIKKS